MQRRQGRLAGLDTLAVDQADPAGEVFGADMHMCRRPMAQRPLAGEQRAVHIDPLRRQVRPGDDPVAAPYLVERDPGEMDRAAVAGPHRWNVAVVDA